jgi:hypothetical protein
VRPGARVTLPPDALAAWCRLACATAAPLPAPAVRDARTVPILLANRLGPALARALATARPAAGDAVHAAVAAAFTADARIAAERGLAALAALRPLAAALDAAEIPWLLWKGPELAQRAWGDPTARHLSDLDVVVAPPDRDRALAALTAGGWLVRDGLSARQARAIHGSTRAIPLVRPGAPLIELHWAFSSRLFPEVLAPAEVLARADRLALAGVEVRVPALPDTLLLLALHATKHGWSQAEEVVTFTRLSAHAPNAGRRRSRGRSRSAWRG